MFDNMENLKIYSSLHQNSKKHSHIEKRHCHGFIMRFTGEVRYDFDDRSIVVHPGEMIFIPAGTRYDYTVVSSEDSMYTSINFLADIPSPPEPRLYSTDNFYEGEHIFCSIADLWALATESDKHRCMAMLYSVFAFVSDIEHRDYADKRKYNIIEPAVSYLKCHIYDCDLKTEALHKMCGVSDTYFRKIFVARFNTTPQNYIISRRLSHARTIIESGDFETIRDVAFSVGFNDPLYFGKVFRRAYGVCPSELASGRV